jgi:hypothetical protein
LKSAQRARGKSYSEFKIPAFLDFLNDQYNNRVQIVERWSLIWSCSLSGALAISMGLSDGPRRFEIRSNFHGQCLVETQGSVVLFSRSQETRVLLLLLLCTIDAKWQL